MFAEGAADLAGRLGRRKVLWAMIVIMLTGVALTLFSQIVIILAGIAVATFGFFGAHSVASSWVGRRAQRGRAQASALYLFCYYAGSSIVGSVGGLFWSSAGWIPPVLKYGIAAICWAGVLGYLVLQGRRAH